MNGHRKITLRKKENFTLPEFFLTRKILELSNYVSLDSYRAKLNNPKTIIKELCEVLIDWDSRKIKSFETVKSVIKEASLLLNDENELIFENLTKVLFLNILNKTSKDNYIQLLYLSRDLNLINESYSEVLFSKIENEITLLNNKTELTTKSYSYVSKLIGHLITELCDMGYSKTSIFNNCLNLLAFGGKNTKEYSFEESFTRFKLNFILKKPDSYSVYYKANLVNTDLETLKNKIPELLSPKDIADFLSIDSKEIRKFKNDRPKEFPVFFAIKVEALDFYGASKRARARISEIIDLVKLGYTTNTFKIYKNNILINESLEPRVISDYTVFYQVDGKLDTSATLYHRFSNQYSDITNNSNIQTETKEKLKSAIRYFRIGQESLEIEQRFINYWIGIEYLFSNYDISSGTFQRFHNFFPKLHSIKYLQRNFNELHDDILQLKHNDTLNDYISKEDLNYLINPTTLDSLITHFLPIEPLLAYRADSLLTVLKSDNEFKKYTKNHITNLEHHLTRIYRIRNQIVHEAAIKPNIENLTANLRYYLIFTIQELFYYFSELPTELNYGKLWNIDDFFIYKMLEVDNISINKDSQKALLSSEYNKNIIF